MKLQNKTKSTVGKWILQKVNTPAWRAGNITGYKHYNHKDKEDSLRLLMEEVGSREQFMQQVKIRQTMRIENMTQMCCMFSHMVSFHQKSGHFLHK